MAQPWYDSESDSDDLSRVVFVLAENSSVSPGPMYEMEGIYENVTDGYNYTEGDNFTGPWRPPYWVLLSIAVYLTVIGLASTIGNILFIMTATRWRFMRNNAHMLLLLNMSVCDLAISLTGYPYTTVSGYLGKWPFGDLICTLYGFLCFTFAQVSINTLVAVSAFRYIAICRPHIKHLLRPEFSWLAIVICWVHALFWTATPLLGWSSYTFEPTGISCSLNWHDRSASGISYTLGCILFCYVIHIVALAWCYIKIFQKVTNLGASKNWRKMRDRQAMEVDSPGPQLVCESVVVFAFISENLSPLEAHVLRMNVVMVVSFILCWTPYAVISFLSLFNEKLSPFWYVFPTMFAKTSCVLNPLVYGLTNRFLRKELLSVVRKCCGLTTPMEDFQIMRQRQQEGLYNKEGIYTGRRAKWSCTCDRCIASAKSKGAITHREMTDIFIRQLKAREAEEERQRQEQSIATTTSSTKNLISPSSGPLNLAMTKTSKGKTTLPIVRSASVNQSLLRCTEKNDHEIEFGNNNRPNLINSRESPLLLHCPSSSMPTNLAPTLPTQNNTIGDSQEADNTAISLALAGTVTGSRQLFSNLVDSTGFSSSANTQIVIKNMCTSPNSVASFCHHSDSDNTNNLYQTNASTRDFDEKHLPHSSRNYGATILKELTDLVVFSSDTPSSTSTNFMQSPASDILVSHSQTITSV